MTYLQPGVKTRYLKEVTASFPFHTHTYTYAQRERERKRERKEKERTCVVGEIAVEDMRHCRCHDGAAFTDPLPACVRRIAGKGICDIAVARTLDTQEVGEGLEDHVHERRQSR